MVISIVACCLTPFDKGTIRCRQSRFPSVGRCGASNGDTRRGELATMKTPKIPFFERTVPADTFLDAEVPAERAKMTALKRRSLLARVVFSHFGHPDGGFCT